MQKLFYFMLSLTMKKLSLYRKYLNLTILEGFSIENTVVGENIFHIQHWQRELHHRFFLLLERRDYVQGQHSNDKDLQLLHT